MQELGKDTPGDRGSLAPGPGLDFSPPVLAPCASTAALVPCSWPRRWGYSPLHCGSSQATNPVTDSSSSRFPGQRAVGKPPTDHPPGPGPPCCLHSLVAATLEPVIARPVWAPEGSSLVCPTAPLTTSEPQEGRGLPFQRFSQPLTGGTSLTLQTETLRDPKERRCFLSTHREWARELWSQQPRAGLSSSSSTHPMTLNLSFPSTQ